MNAVLLLLLPAALVRAVVSQSHMFYLIQYQPRSWTDAQTFCRQHYLDLATMEDLADQEELVRILPPGYKGYMWVGLWRPDADSVWFWSDRSSSTFIPWDSGQPNNFNNSQYCAAATSAGLLNDQNCVKEFPFICYNERMKYTLKLTLSSSLSLDDPTLETDLQQKIQELMNEKGLTIIAKITWTVHSDGNVFQKIQKSELQEIQQICL